VPERPRWLVPAAGAPPLAFAFHALEGHVRVPASAVIAEAGGDRDCVRGMAPLEGGARPIVDVPAARAAVLALTGHRIEERQT
jgi:purine-binding chemotaxis protein CheW